MGQSPAPAAQSSGDKDDSRGRGDGGAVAGQAGPPSQARTAQDQPRYRGVAGRHGGPADPADQSGLQPQYGADRLLPARRAGRVAAAWGLPGARPRRGVRNILANLAVNKNLDFVLV